ncbi:MAG: chemotaxis protein CheB [Gloeocapsa sp. UFS-A4-WI-NPMV-4B04]|jgi:two-component system chemotaxis response regulator CheB|nr:chemotaxis protein CheB [Gloeocapsa sp. UFS-A4-WI-NPMV-4B04]
MPGHNIIVIGASAGGVEALAQLVDNLPPDLPAAIFVVLHVPAQGTSVLPSILNHRIKKQHKNTSLWASHPQDGEKIEQGRIYVAPPDHHLLIKNGYIRLARGPKENSHRPAVDPLFRTAARVYGSRVVGIVLSGTLDDGTAGLLAVKQQGGIAIVQNPEEAMYSGMPANAIENVDVDHILPVAEIASVLVALIHKSVETGEPTVSHDMEIETDSAELEINAMQKLERPGTPSPYACPDCNGVLWEIDEGGVLRFRCRTGHAYSANSLMAEQSQALEEALWNALRALEEKAALSERLAVRSRDRNQNLSAKRFEDQRQFAQQRATLIRQLLLKGDKNSHLSSVNGQVIGEQSLASSLGNNGSKTVNPVDLNIVAIGTSDGAGVNALSEVLRALPADFPAAITVVQPLNPQQFSQLLDILSQRTSMIVKQAQQGDSLLSGTVYIAPPHNHLLVNSDNTISLFSSELVHFARPSVDLLFESVAASFKQRAVAVVLSGTDGNGAMGVQAIRKKRGIAIAQQATAASSDMPIAIDNGSVDWVLPLNEIAATLMKLLTEEREIEEEIGGQTPLFEHTIS